MNFSKTNSQILVKSIFTTCNEGNEYVFRQAKRKGRWCVYFSNKSNRSTHRIVLNESYERYPNPSLDGLKDAKQIKIKTYFDHKNKIYRSEKIKEY